MHSHEPHNWNEVNARLRRLHDLHAEYPTIDLAKEATTIAYEGFEEINFERHDLSDVDFERHMLNVRSALVLAISEVGTFLNLFKEEGVIDTCITRAINNGQHPLDAICVGYLSVFKMVVEKWSNGEAHFFPESKAVHDYLDRDAAYKNAFELVGVTDKNAHDTVWRGANVGTYIVLACIESFECCWKQQFGESIPPDVLRTQLEHRSAYPLLRVWKWMKSGKKLDEFEGSCMTEGSKDGNPYVFTKFNPEKIHLVPGKEDGLWLPLPTDEVIESLELMDTDNNPFKARGKCPADSAFDARDATENLQKNYMYKLLKHLEAGEESGDFSFAFRARNSIMMQLIDSMHEWALQYWLPYYEEGYGRDSASN